MTFNHLKTISTEFTHYGLKIRKVIGFFDFQSLMQRPLCRLFELRLQLHGAIYRPDSFVLMLSYCANLKTIRYESTSLNRIVADKSHRVIAA